MLLEIPLEDGVKVFIDAEVSAGLSKNDDVDHGFYPEDTLDNVVKVAANVGKRLAGAASEVATSFPSPSELELTFAIKVDANAVVSVSKEIAAGQFLVKATWKP